MRPVNSDASRITSISPEMDRYNGRLYFFSYLLIFLCAPIDYVGVVQAALCNRLGTSHTIANLPAATYSLGYILPFFLSAVIPYRLERALLTLANVVTAASTAIVCVVLFFPFSTPIRVAAVIIQGGIVGLSACTADVYTFQCLGRGTTEIGRDRIFKLTFTISPLFGVAGSLIAQFILGGGIPRVRFPYDFGLLYFFCLPCMGGVAFLSSRYKMIWLEERPRSPIFQSVSTQLRSYAANRNLVLLWFAYLFWFFSINSSPNLSLYALKALGKSPSLLAGLSMALTFGGKSIGGFILGAVAVRRGSLAASGVSTLLAGGALAWACLVPGYSYLLSFAFIGAGALGGTYFPNCVFSFSPPSSSTSDLAVLSLTRPVSSIAPMIYGVLADSYGFRASFIFGMATAALAWWLVCRVSSGAKASEFRF